MQLFLLGKLIGLDDFVSSAGPDLESVGGRCLYASLLAEAIPRALLSSLGLSRDLLGASSGGEFLIAIAEESLPPANQFLVDATRRLQERTGHRLRLIWASTENLGAWSDVRHRLDASLAKWRGAGALEPASLFEPFDVAEDPIRQLDAECRRLFREMPASAAAEWSAESPFLLKAGTEALPVATHAAQSDLGPGPASLAELASRAAGMKRWGVLRGDVNQFASRMRRAQSIEEYIQFSVYFRQFFAGEVQVLCSQGEFWRKVTVLYTGGDDFAVCGSWDALIPFAAEIQRLFLRSVEEFLKEFPGAEGKTMSMALAVASHADSTLPVVFAEAGRGLELAKNSGRDSFALLGRTLDWKQLAQSVELKDLMLTLVRDYGCPPQLLGELGSFYRESDRALPTRGAKGFVERKTRPWRFYRRLARLLDVPSRHRDFQKARTRLLGEFLPRGQAQVKLKPSGRVALDWARFMQDSD